MLVIGPGPIGLAAAALARNRGAAVFGVASEGKRALAIVLVFGTIVFVLWLGAHAVLAGTMTGGDLGQFILYATIVAGADRYMSDFGALDFYPHPDLTDAVLGINPEFWAWGTYRGVQTKMLGMFISAARRASTSDCSECSATVIGAMSSRNSFFDCIFVSSKGSFSV